MSAPPEVPASVPEAPGPPLPPASPPSRTDHFGVALGPVGSLGFAPSPSIGAAAAFDVHSTRLSLALEVHGDLPASRSYSVGVTSGRVETYVLAASLVPCVHSGFLLYGCGVVTVGDFHEQGEDVAVPRSGSAVIVEAGRLGVELPLGDRLSLFAQVDGLFILTRHSVSLDGTPVSPCPCSPVRSAPGHDSDSEMDPGLSSPSTLRERSFAVAVRRTSPPPDRFRALFEREISYVWNTLRRLGVAER